MTLATATFTIRTETEELAIIEGLAETREWILIHNPKSAAVVLPSGGMLSIQVFKMWAISTLGALARDAARTTK